MRLSRWTEIGIACAFAIGAAAGCKHAPPRPMLQDITVTRTATGVCMGEDDYQRLLDNLADLMMTVEACEDRR